MGNRDVRVHDRVPQSIQIRSVIGNAHSCVYLPDRTANLPLVLPSQMLSEQAIDDALEAGMRRSGYFLYYTDCPSCRACEPTRLKVSEFKWTDSWRRIRNRGDKTIQVSIGRPEATPEKVELFNRHRNERGLSESGMSYQVEDYVGFLVESSGAWTYELLFYEAERLIAVSIVDCGRSSISAVYTYFDPEFSKYSLGTYSILKQIEYCLATGREYLYLGLFVAENKHLSYKSRFLPQQRRIGEKWIDIGVDHNPQAILG